MISEYIKDKQAGWTGKTLLEYQGYFKLLQDVLGVQRIAEITRDEVRKLRDALCLLPAHLYKRHPGKTIKEVLALDNITPMSTTTVNKLLTLFGSIMLHCIKEGHLRDNPAEGLKIQKKKRPDEERKVYAPDDLKKMVVALPSPASKPERYWIPLLGMFTGMRLGEICGLHIEDVKSIDGIWCIDVNGEDDKRLKNLSSKRVVPLHPALIQLGFLAFVESIHDKGHARMWPNLKRRGTDGYCHAIGKWFQRFNRQHVTNDPLKTFHSLRHTFADTLKQQGEQEALISELMGHANASITTGRYGKRYRPQGLLEAVSRLDYGILVAP
jgi:integrase